MYRGTLLEILNMGSGEIMLILVVVLLLFGGKKLPELARGLGKGIRDFKDASEGVKREIHRNINSVDIVDDIKSGMDDVKNSFNDSPYEAIATTETVGVDDEMYPGTLEEENSNPVPSDSPDESNGVEDSQKEKTKI